MFYRITLFIMWAMHDIKTQENGNVFNKDIASKVLLSYLFSLAPSWSRNMRDET